MTSIISTFSGCGGSSLGYKLAGCTVRLAVEWEDNAVDTYRRNFPTTPVFHGDIASLTVDRARQLAGLAPDDELDIFDGSPPCQGFSTANTQNRDVGDDRNRLFEEYVRLLRGLRPRAFIMENVKGMTIGVMRPVFDEAMRQLRASGYRVKCRVLNAKWYGVAQSRERAIFIGIREDLGVEPSHPQPTITTPITAGEAIRGVVPGADTPKMTDRYGRLWTRVPPGKTALTVLRTLGREAGYNTTVKLSPDKVAPTITKTQGGRGFATLCHWSEPRALATEEAQRLASFPDDFVFVGKYRERWARIGNCVPPLLMRAVAAHVKTLISR